MIKDLETAIGYQFHNISLLQNALTHSSYANERWHNSLLSNERLEFLGDSILGMLVAEYLYRNFPDRPEGRPDPDAGRHGMREDPGARGGHHSPG